MILTIVLVIYLILFCLGFWTDLKLSIKSKDKYYLFSIPLTAPIIGAKIILELLKKVNQKG